MFLQNARSPIALIHETKIEQMHIARGLTAGIYVYPYKSLGPVHNLIGDIVLIQQNPHHSSLI
jgi:hypothetical protein